MALTSADYLQQLQDLLPQGPAWPRDPDALVTKILYNFADEFARVDIRIDDLLNEADPRTTFELLTDWERVCGLPDGCVGEQDGLQARRAAVLGRLTSIGGQSIDYFESLAATIGYTITITEYEVHDCEDDCDTQINEETWAYVFDVNAATTTVRELDCEDDCDTALAIWGNALLECMINRLKPAHTLAIFKYR